MQNGATASGQRREEKMNKFDVEFETKMQLEQAGFERRKPELEMKHHLLEESVS